MSKALVIPVSIVAFVVLAFASMNAYRVPTLEHSFTGERPDNVGTVHYTVTGLKCRGTSNLFARQIADVPGVVSLTTFARTHTAIVEYDPSRTDPNAIREAAVEPIAHEGKLWNVFEIVSQRDAE